MQMISAPLVSSEAALPEVAVRVERLKLARRLWRGVADDGQEFGFELEAPLKDSATVWQTTIARYVIRQEAEPVIEVVLDVTPSAAAGLGWAIGNLHLELSAGPGRLLAPDDPAVRQLLDRLAVPYKAVTAVFHPGRFARGNQIHELGPGHRH